MPGFVAPFDISHPPIGSLLLMHSMKIPELQRPYAWGAENARELCSDLEKLLDDLRAGKENPQHFFGTLVVLTSAGQRDEIIDGQQRMTTVTLLLGQIRRALISLRDECRAIARLHEGNSSIVQHHNSIANVAENSVTLLQNLLFINDGFTAAGEAVWEPRISVSPEIAKTYRNLLDGGDGKIASENLMPARNLRSVSGVFENRLVEPSGFDQKEPRERLDYLDSLLKVVRDGLVVVRLGTAVADSGYELFESLNARGVHLNVLDHLKVWMLAEFAQADRESTEVAAVMRDLASDNPEEQVKFFQDFYQARTLDTASHDGITQPKELVKFARKKLFRDPSFEGGAPDSMVLTDRIQHEVDYMRKLFPFWTKLKQHVAPTAFEDYENLVWLENRLELLFATLRHQAAFPFLMVAAERLRDDPETFDDLIHTIEKFFFRFKTICGGSENLVVGAYCTLLADLDAHPKSFNLNLVKTTFRSLLVEHAPDDRFKEKLLMKLSYDNAASRIRIKYFFEMLENYCYKDMPFKRPQLLSLSEWHLEHIVPQNPAPGGAVLDQESLDSIGNLCLLPPWINTKLSNLEYVDKCAEAQRLNSLPGNERIKIGLADPEKIFYSPAATTWSSADVAKRIVDLGTFACQVFQV